MSSAKSEIVSRMVGLVEKPGLGLRETALCGDVIVADARFNLWVGTEGKTTCGDERLLELVEAYERLTQACVTAAARFEEDADSAGLERSLGEVLVQLKGMVGSEAG